MALMQTIGKAFNAASATAGRVTSRMKGTPVGNAAEKLWERMPHLTEAIGLGIMVSSLAMNAFYYSKNDPEGVKAYESCLQKKEQCMPDKYAQAKKYQETAALPLWGQEYWVLIWGLGGFWRFNRTRHRENKKLKETNKTLTGELADLRTKYDGLSHLAAEKQSREEQAAEAKRLAEEAATIANSKLDGTVAVKKQLTIARKLPPQGGLQK